MILTSSVHLSLLVAADTGISMLQCTEERTGLGWGWEITSLQNVAKLLQTFSWQTENSRALIRHLEKTPKASKRNQNASSASGNNSSKNNEVSSNRQTNATYAFCSRHRKWLVGTDGWIANNEKRCRQWSLWNTWELLNDILIPAEMRRSSRCNRGEGSSCARTAVCPFLHLAWWDWASPLWQSAKGNERYLRRKSISNFYVNSKMTFTQNNTCSMHTPVLQTNIWGKEWATWILSWFRKPRKWEQTTNTTKNDSLEFEKFFSTEHVNTQKLHFKLGVPQKPTETRRC